MLSRKWLALAAWAFVPLAATAQQDTAASRPGDARRHAGTLAYESAFDHYRVFGEESEAPDLAWRAANDDMARLGGHAGHMKDKPAQPTAAPAAHEQMPAQDEVMEHRAHRHGETP